VPVPADINERFDDAFRSGVLVGAVLGHHAVQIGIVAVERDVGHIVGDEQSDVVEAGRIVQDRRKDIRCTG